MVLLKLLFSLIMSDLLIVQKVFRHYRRDFYNGLLASNEFNITCLGEQNEIDELKPIFKQYKFNGFPRFNIFSTSLLVEIYKSHILVFPADLQYPLFVIFGYIAKAFGKEVYFLGHLRGSAIVD